MYNTWYPDVDDTAVAIIAFLEQNPASVESDCILAAANWILGMQSSDRGWVSFDVDNDKLWSNKIPFGDMDALCDPSTSDVTGLILEALGLMMKCAREQCIDLGELSNCMDIACHRGIAFIAKSRRKMEVGMDDGVSIIFMAPEMYSVPCNTSSKIVSLSTR
jgi:squalene-hopene/tetraprenyl-beta-curcumene cyclase